MQEENRTDTENRAKGSMETVGASFLRSYTRDSCVVEHQELISQQVKLHLCLFLLP